MPAEVARAWAAGLYDGEGSTTIDGRRATGPRRYPTLRCSMAQNGNEVLERFAAVLSVGRIYCPSPSATYEKWTWAVGGREAITALRIMWPYLSAPKRRQATEALAVYDAGFALRRYRRRRTSPDCEMEDFNASGF